MWISNWKPFILVFCLLLLLLCYRFMMSSRASSLLDGLEEDLIFRTHYSSLLLDGLVHSLLAASRPLLLVDEDTEKASSIILLLSFLIFLFGFFGHVKKKVDRGCVDSLENTSD